MTIHAHLSLTQCLVLTDFGDLGLGNGCDPTPIFDDAASAFADLMETGCDSRVYQLQFRTGDLIDEATDAVARWVTGRGQALPFWMMREAAE